MVEMPTIHVATANGVRSWETGSRDTGPRDTAGGPDVALDGRRITGLARADDDIWAVADHRELWKRSPDGWTLVVDVDGSRATCIASIDGELWVGTSEAHLLTLRDGALHVIDAFDHVPSRDAWYTPWGGPPDTRSIANWDDDVYVNVHVGGIPRTDDGGATWAPTIDIDADVHQVTTAEGLVLAACAEGLAVSADRGGSWSMRTQGLERTYCRAVAVCDDGVLLSSSDGPRGGRATVSRAPLSGGTFEPVDAGPGSFDGNIDTMCLDALPDGSVAAFGTEDGNVYVSGDAGANWDELASSLPQIRRVLVMP